MPYPVPAIISTSFSNTVSMREALYVNGACVHADNLEAWSADKTGIAAELGLFLAEWYAPAPTILLQTSGSTGTPKQMQASKEAMRASARMTCEYFGLTPDKTALLCLPLRYIAGKMMVVRALVSGCKLILAEPSSTPLAGLSETIDFAPLVPMQVASTLKAAEGAEQLSRVRHILLGGGFVDTSLTRALQCLPSQVYASYGMTETLSHIALRHVNGIQRSEWYTPLTGVMVELTNASTLAITAPHVGALRLATNDLAEIAPDGRFRILGRRDSVINSGGVKIQAEEVEQALSAVTGLTLLVLPAPHSELGECVALLWEGDTEAEAALQTAIATLPPYHRPRIVRHVPQIPRTDTGKLNRKAAQSAQQW